MWGGGFLVLLFKDRQKELSLQPNTVVLEENNIYSTGLVPAISFGELNQQCINYDKSIT